MALFVAFVLICGIGISSSYIWGPDNTAEQMSEEFIDEIIEYQLNLPDGSVNIDLSPDSK